MRSDAPGAERELGFLHVTPDGDVFTAAIDLAAPGEEGLVLLDVKTNQGDEAAARRKAKQYAPQRDVYVQAADRIGAAPVERFAFQFSRAEVQVSEPVTETLRGEIAVHLEERVQRIGIDKPPLTNHPGECWFCGYKKVGLCEGAGKQDVR